MDGKVTFLTEEPTIEIIADMALDPRGIEGMVDWVRSHRPECLPDELAQDSHSFDKLFPHDLSEPNKLIRSMRQLTHNELLVELAGRKCYDSFGLKAGKKSNREYIEHTQSGEVKHASILYHAKMTFFFAGLSRRVSQEMMRNYVGADRDQEGSPSQESTRYTHHYGYYVAHPTVLADPEELEIWKSDITAAHDRYTAYIQRRFDAYEKKTGELPKGIDRKRIYEASIGRMPWEFETSFIWTTNPMAISKFCFERDNEAADMEIQRFARKWKRVCVHRWPNLFPQPHMQEVRL